MDVAGYFHICFQCGVTFFSSVQSKNKKVSVRIKSMNLDKEYLVLSVPTPQYRSKVSGSLHVMARSCCLVHPPTVFDQQLIKYVASNFNKQS